MIPTRFNPLGYQEPDYAGAIEISYNMRGNPARLILKEPLPTDWSNSPYTGAGPTFFYVAIIKNSTLADNIYVYILDGYGNKTLWTDLSAPRFVPNVLPGPISGPGTYYFLFQWMKKSIVLPYSLKVPYIKSTWGRD